MNKISRNGAQWIDEYTQGVRYGLKGRILAEETSPYQNIKIIDSTRYGKALLLDNCWMTAEKQEKQYHESLVHPAMCGSNQIEKILIIGGGDGGSARECLKYKEVKHLDYVESYQRLNELSQKFLPTIGDIAWTDPRLHIQVDNGLEWVANVQENSYDVILVDGADPIGPAKDLFNESFLNNCRRILHPEGVFATQSESPEAFCQLHIDIIKILRKVFDYADPLYGWVPMYPSGWWSWTFASMKTPRFLYPKPNRASSIEKNCEIWSMRWQKGAFETMPAFITKKLNK